MFVIGVLADQGQWLRKIPARTGVLWLAIGIAAGALRYLHPIGTDGGLTLASLIKSTWEAFVAVGMCIGLIVLFREYLAVPHRLVQTAAPGAYDVYLIHPFVVVPLQFGLLALAAPPLLKFALVVTVAVPVSFALAALLRRLPGARAML
jgi:glucan biosynthesis protein C